MDLYQPYAFRKFTSDTILSSMQVWKIIARISYILNQTLYIKFSPL